MAELDTIMYLTWINQLAVVRFAVGPVAEMPETPTHLSLLSDSVMRTPALNELPDDNNEGNVLECILLTITIW